MSTTIHLPDLPEVAAALPTEADVAAALEETRFSILTAGNPARTPERDFADADADLAAELWARGYSPVSLFGVYKGESDGRSYLVPGLEAEEARELGRIWGQESVITPEGLADCESGETHPWDGDVIVGEEARLRDYYSVLPGVGIAFSLVI